MKVAIVGAGTRIGQPGFAFVDELRHGGIVVEHKLANDFEGDCVVIPRRAETERPVAKRHTGAARIKRVAKQRRNRKGK